MKSTNPIETMDVYASTSQYISGPTSEQQAAGTIPLDTLPADWWNWLWKSITTRINEASTGMESVYEEILSVLSAASITPSETSVNQLLTAIQSLIRTPGSSTTAGTVKSSTDSGKVAIDANGYMTPNGMGIPNNLNTTAKVIVSAVNEVLSALNNYKVSNDSAVTGLSTSKAPIAHASTSTTYGIGTSSNYGHVKLSDSTTSTSSTSSGVAATPAAVKSAYDLANSAKSTADTAQSTANSAQSTADTAKSTANSAKSTADTAQSTANSRAPIAHASTSTTYGIGTSSNYGHVKLSDSTTSTSSTSSGVAATPAAVKSAYDLANSAKSTADTAQSTANSAQSTANSKAAVGSTAGAADTSSGSSGSATTAARSDHTHPFPGLVYNGTTKSKVTFSLSGTTLTITTTSV